MNDVLPDAPIDLSLDDKAWSELARLAQDQKVAVSDIARIAIYREISRHKQKAAHKPPFKLLERFRVAHA